MGMETGGQNRAITNRWHSIQVPEWPREPTKKSPIDPPATTTAQTLRDDGGYSVVASEEGGVLSGGARRLERIVLYHPSLRGCVNVLSHDGEGGVLKNGLWLPVNHSTAVRGPSPASCPNKPGSSVAALYKRDAGSQ